jgi:transcription initiation factor TFIIB
MIDERSEWRTFTDKDKPGDDPNRVGGPVNALLSDGGMSTMIAGGKGVDRGLINNLQRLQNRTEVGPDRHLIAAIREVGRVCSSMRLPDLVKHQANEYFKEATEKSKSVKGKAQPAVIAAVVFLACRQTGYSRTFKEICAFVPAAKVKDIGRMYKAIVADLKLKETGTFRSEVGAIHPENFLRRFMSMLGFNNTDMIAGVALSNAMLPQEGAAAGMHEEIWHGKSPLTIAGTIMFVVGNLPRASKKPTLEDICAVCGVAESTIKHLYTNALPYWSALIAAAGGFATKEEIAKLPTFDKTPTAAPERQQQQQQQL